MCKYTVVDEKDSTWGTTRAQEEIQGVGRQLTELEL